MALLYDKLGKEVENMQEVNDRQFTNLHNGVSLLEEWQAKTLKQPKVEQSSVDLAQISQLECKIADLERQIEEVAKN